MILALQILTILFISALLVLWTFAKRQRDMCRPPSNEERLLQYIDRRAEWEREQRKRKVLQRRRVERMLEQRWLDRRDPRPKRGPTVPQPRTTGRAA